MNIFKYLIAATVFTLHSTNLSAQDINQDKMDRDLKIAEDIVSSLIKSESDDGRFYAANPKATYIPGFGVMIDISTSGRFYSPNFDSDYNLSFVVDDVNLDIDLDAIAELEMKAEILARQAEEIERQSEIVERENERIAREHKRALEEQERELEREMERLEREREREYEREKSRYNRDRDRDEQARIQIKSREVDRVVVSQDADDEYTYRYSYSRSDDDDEISPVISYGYEKRGYQKDFDDLKPMYRNVIITFLTDYSDLIGQLKDDEQVMLVAKGGPQAYGQIHIISSDEGGKFSGAARRRDIRDFKTGNMSRATFENTINFVESKASEKKAADLELLASIFQRLYKSDLATTYYTTTPISFERLKSFGAIYKMKMYSSVPVGRDTYRIITQKQSSMTRSERNKKVKEMYPQFIGELKQNIIDYGKTIKSLDADESILFQIRLNECNTCDLPNEIHVLVKNQTIIDLESGIIDERQALNNILVNDVK